MIGRSVPDGLGAPEGAEPPSRLGATPAIRPANEATWVEAITAWNTRTPSISGQEVVTEEMVEAGQQAWVDWQQSLFPRDCSMPEAIYRAMVSAVSLPQGQGVPAAPSGQSDSAPSPDGLGHTATVPNAMWQPMSRVPKHGNRIYALERGGRASIIYANPELDRRLFLAWAPLPDHGRGVASAIEAATAGETAQTGSTEGESAVLEEQTPKASQE